MSKRTLLPTIGGPAFAIGVLATISVGGFVVLAFSRRLGHDIGWGQSDQSRRAYLRDPAAAVGQ
jgi:hypothetical protein